MIYLFLKIVFILTNSADHDEILLYVAFHQGLHCWPKYRFMVIKNEQGVCLLIIKRLIMLMYLAGLLRGLNFGLSLTLLQFYMQAAKALTILHICTGLSES